MKKTNKAVIYFSILCIDICALAFVAPFFVLQSQSAANNTLLLGAISFIGITALGALFCIMFVQNNCRNAHKDQGSVDTICSWLDSLFDGSPMGIMLVDEHKRIIYMNTEGLRLIKRTQQEIIGNVCHNCICPADINFCPVLDLGDTLNHSERTILTADGIVTPVIKSVNKIYIAGKLYLLEEFIDIKQLKDIEQQLINERNMIKQYLDIAGVIFIALDTQGRITLINTKGCDLLGYTHDEIIGKEWFDNFIPVSDKQETENYFISFFDITDENQTINELLHENKILCRNGEELLIQWNTVILRDRTGTPTGILSSGTDITVKKRMEEYLTKSAKLDSLAILAGGIAHDFNNLLTAIMGNVSLAKLDMHNDCTLGEYLNNAEAASMQARELSNQLLTFSKGNSPIKKTASISDIIRNSAKFILKGTNVRAECYFQDELWMAEVDPNQLSQVVNNLIINSVQAMPRGGTIFIMGENSILTPANEFKLKAGNYIHFSFHDEGSGIEEDYIKKIFDPYFTTKEQGNGLGLATCYSIIKKHDGTITADSMHNVGTIFHIYLPAAISSSQMQPVMNTFAKKALTHTSLPPRRALVMDDDPAINLILKEMLHRLGYHATCTANSAEAIQTFKNAIQDANPFDIIIVNLTIPGEIGAKEVISQLRTINPNITAIVSSGYSADPVMADCKHYGFDATLAKPISLEQLDGVLSTLMQSSDTPPHQI